MDDNSVLTTIKSFNEESKYKSYPTIWPCIVIREALIRRGITAEIVQSNKVGTGSSWPTNTTNLLYYCIKIDNVGGQSYIYDICSDFYKMYDPDSSIYDAYSSTGLAEIIDQGPRWCTINLITLIAYNKLYVECSSADLAPLYY